MEISLTINGKLSRISTEPRTLLANLLREECGLTGTHIGCDTAQCGCCTVLLDGDAVKSCAMLAVQAEGCSVQTIEGLAAGDELHPMQQAFSDRHALQCGYCTTGFVMSAVELVTKYDKLDEAKVRRLIDGNICRCTGYSNIVAAILDVAHGRKTCKFEDIKNV
jgi:carbon-monoxide dehydrogenase small subunit